MNVAQPILILGAGGMLGYALAADLRQRGRDIVATTRTQAWTGRFPAPARLLPGVDALDFPTLEAALDHVRPTVVINAIAMRSAASAGDTRRMIRINGEFPHALAEACARRCAHLIQFSTDGVFDGRTGGYDETSAIAPHDTYSRSKAAGEVCESAHALTIRTSMIGLSPDGKGTLVDWLLGERDRPVSGYSKAIFTGLPVTEIAQFLDTRLLASDKLPGGLFHLAAEPISKLRLLQLLRGEWGFDPGTIAANDTVEYDRSLVTVRPALLGDYRPPPWPQMIGAMRAFYERLAPRR